MIRLFGKLILDILSGVALLGVVVGALMITGYLYRTIKGGRTVELSKKVKEALDSISCNVKKLFSKIKISISKYSKWQKAAALLLALSIVLAVCLVAVKVQVNVFFRNVEEASEIGYISYKTKEEFPEVNKNKYFEPTLLAHISAEDPEEAVDLVSYLTKIGYVISSDVETSLSEKVLSVFSAYDSEESFYDCLNLLVLLDNNDIQLPTLKAGLLPIWASFQNDIYNSKSAKLLINYISIAENLSAGYYLSVIDLFPYNDFCDAVKSTGTKVITESGQGGYYDKRSSEYKNEFYWYSPLFKTRSSKGEIGTYKYSKNYTLAGDLLLSYESTYWYDTERNDPHNSDGGKLWYKGQYISGNYSDARVFLEKTSLGDTYILQDDNADILITLGRSSLYIFDSDKGYELKYS